MSYATWSLTVPNLQIWYRFNDPDTIVNGAAINDASGNTNHGVYDNSPPGILSATGLVVGDSDTAIYLPNAGNSPYVPAAKTASVNNVATFSIEMMTSAVDTTTGRCLFTRSSTAGFLLAKRNHANHDVQVYMGGSGNSVITDPVGDWDQTHIWLLVYDGGQSTNFTKLKVYRDGVLLNWAIENGNIPGTSPSNSSDLDIGFLSGNYMDGVVDEFKVYSDAKNADYALESYRYVTGYYIVGSTDNAILFGSNF